MHEHCISSTNRVIQRNLRHARCLRSSRRRRTPLTISQIGSHDDVLLQCIGHACQGVTHACQLPAGGRRPAAGTAPTANTENAIKSRALVEMSPAELHTRHQPPYSRYIAAPYVVGTRRPIIAPSDTAEGPKSSAPMMVAGSATNRTFSTSFQSASARGADLTGGLWADFSDFPGMTGEDGCIPAAPGARSTITLVLQNLRPDSKVW